MTNKNRLSFIDRKTCFERASHAKLHTYAHVCTRDSMDWRLHMAGERVGAGCGGDVDRERVGMPPEAAPDLGRLRVHLVLELRALLRVDVLRAELVVLMIGPVELVDDERGLVEQPGRERAALTPVQQELEQV